MLIINIPVGVPIQYFLQPSLSMVPLRLAQAVAGNDTNIKKGNLIYFHIVHWLNSIISARADLGIVPKR